MIETLPIESAVAVTPTSVAPPLSPVKAAAPVVGVDRGWPPAPDASVGCPPPLGVDALLPLLAPVSPTDMVVAVATDDGPTWRFRDWLAPNARRWLASKRPP